MLGKLCTLPVALLYVAVVVLDRSSTLRRATATVVIALLCITCVALCR